MFDKVAYKKNRKAGKRGQGELPKGKISPKGVPVYTYSNGENVDINKIGQHRSFDKNGKMQIFNRTESRRKLKLRVFTTKREYNKKYSSQPMLSEEEQKNVPTWRAKLPKNWEQPTPSQPVSLSNHDRHTLRQAQRALKLKMEREKAEAK